jgi:hypothetical protein
MIIYYSLRAILKDRKRRPEGVNESLKFLLKLSTTVLNSSPKTNHENYSQIYNTQANRWREYLDSFHEMIEDQRKRRNMIRSSNDETTNKTVSLELFHRKNSSKEKWFNTSMINQLMLVVISW